MEEVEFFDWTLAIDTRRTSDAYVQLDPVVPSHCEICAAFVCALDRNLIPEPVIRLLQCAGADPYKLHEAWGAPDGGFLAGSWFIVGAMVRGEWTGVSQGASVELAAGFQCWINGKPTLPAPEAMRGVGLLELEFTWHAPIISTLV
jgi:hypothetical protein